MAVAADNHTAVAEICDVNFLDLNEEVSTNIIGLKHDVMTPLMVAARSNSVKSAGVLLRQESIDVEQSSGMLRRLYIAGKRLVLFSGLIISSSPQLSARNKLLFNLKV